MVDLRRIFYVATTMLTITELVIPATPPKAASYVKNNAFSINDMPADSTAVPIVGYNSHNSGASSKSTSAFLNSSPMQSKEPSHYKTGLEKNQRRLQGILKNTVSFYGTRKSNSRVDNNVNKNPSRPAGGAILPKAGKQLYLAKPKTKVANDVSKQTGKNTSPNQFSAQRLTNVKQAVNRVKSLSTSVTAGSNNPGRNKDSVFTDIAEVGIPLSRSWLDSGSQPKSDHVVKGEPNHVNGIQMLSFTRPKKMDNTIFRNGSIKNRLPKNLVKGNGARRVQQIFANNNGQRKFSLKGGNSLPSNGLHSFLAEVHSSTIKTHSGINEETYVKGLQVKNMTPEQVQRMNQNKKPNKNGFPTTRPNYSLERNVGRQKNPLKENMQSLMVQNKPIIKQGVFINKNQGSGNAKPGRYGAKATANHFDDYNGTGRFGDFREVNNGKHITAMGKPLLNMREKGMKMDHGPNTKGNKGTQKENLQQHHQQTNFNNGYSGFFGGLNSAFDGELQFRKPDQARDEYIEEYDLGDKPVVTAFNQRYVPVDDFGLPFYGNETDDYFKREALEAHNRYRMIHGAPPLKLDPQLSLEAENFAKHLAKLGSARHDIKSSLRKQGEGENVARGCSEWGGLTASGAVHRWYSQVCNYDWSKREKIQRNVKNFMQVVWKGTSQLGIGRAMSKRLGFPCTFIVARYRPGKVNAFTLASNINEGTFMPSYCNADQDDPNSLESNSQNTLKDSKDLSTNIQSFQDSVGPQDGVTYEPINSMDRNLEQLGVEQQNTEALIKGILPNLSYVGSQYEGGKIIVEDEGVKRDKEPSRRTKTEGQHVASKIKPNG